MAPGLFRDFLLSIPDDLFRLLVVVVALWFFLWLLGMNVYLSQKGDRS